MAEEYTQKEWAHLKVYKESGRNANEGAGKTGGKNGSQNERNITEAICSLFEKEGFVSNSVDVWTWPEKAFHEAIIPCEPCATGQKRRCKVLTRGNEVILLVTSFKYGISLTGSHLSCLGNEIQDIGVKNQETDVLLVQANRAPYFLELGYQDVEGNAVDRQYSTLFYKQPLLLAATQGQIKEAVLVSGPAFDKTLGNNKIMKCVEFEIAKKLHNLETLFIGDFDGAWQDIKKHFSV